MSPVRKNVESPVSLCDQTCGAQQLRKVLGWFYGVEVSSEQVRLEPLTQRIQLQDSIKGCSIVSLPSVAGGQQEHETFTLQILSHDGSKLMLLLKHH